MTGQLTLGLARASDPSTSQRAARKDRRGLREAILEQFRRQPNLTDDELAGLLPTFPAASVKTCRSRLTRREHLLVEAGEERLSNYGSPMQAWRLA